VTYFCLFCFRIAKMDIRPNHTIYVNRINEKVKKEGNCKLVFGIFVASCLFYWGCNNYCSMLILHDSVGSNALLLSSTFIKLVVCGDYYDPWLVKLNRISELSAVRLHLIYLTIDISELFLHKS